MLPKQDKLYNFLLCMIHRGVIDQIIPWLGTNKVVILNGARRAGKTVALEYLSNYLKERGDSTFFISAEQKRHLPMFNDPKLFLRFLKEQYGLGDGKKLFVIIDEFQYIRQAGHFFKAIYNAAGDTLQLILAASTTFKVARSTEDLQAIRKMFYVRRLSFEEYMQENSDIKYRDRFALHEEKKIAEFYSLYKEDLEASLSDYLYWGGYPEVVLEKNNDRRFALLDDIIHGHIEKDISSFLRVENVDAYIQLMEVLSSEVGNLLNRQDFSTRLNIHKKTLGKYLEIIDGTFTFSFIPPYFTDTKKELAKMNKIYAQDPGIVSYFLRQTPPEQPGYFPHMSRVKNFVFTELRKHGFKHNIFFYRTIAKAEIDFVLCKDKEVIPIKIKFGKKKQKVPVVVKNFMKTYSDTVHRAIVITQDELRFEKKCLFIPLTVLPFLDL